MKDRKKLVLIGLKDRLEALHKNIFSINFYDDDDVTLVC
jgi:hypothetical protein